MRRVFALFILVACSSPGDKPPPAATAHGLDVSRVVPEKPTEPLAFGAAVPEPAVFDGTPVDKLAEPVALWNARPGVPIAAVFAAEDGTAAVSIDESNHARLWPVLDGSREPLVLPTGMPVQVALAHDGDGFAIAARDESFGLEVLTVSASGALTSHVKFPPEPGVESVIAVGDAFLAVRRDQTIDVLDHRGTRTGTLAPEAGDHIAKVLTRRGAVLALVRTKDELHGRWIELGAKGVPAWSGVTPKLSISLKRVFLSPDRKRLATLRESTGETMLVDLETGKTKAFAIDPALNPPMGAPLGFTPDGRVVIGFNDFELSTFQWWTLKGNETAVLGGNNYVLEFVEIDNARLTDTNIITFSGHELAIATPNDANNPSEVKFLGYRNGRAKALRASAIGVVATIGGVANVLDDHVRVDRRLVRDDAVPVAKDLAIMKVAPRDPADRDAISALLEPEWFEVKLTKHGGVKPHLALYDTAAKRELQQWPPARNVAFEPASKLLAIDRGATVDFATFDSTTRTFGPAKTIAGPVSRVALLDPALAGGNVALLVRLHAGTIEVRTLAKLDGEPSAPRTLTGKLEAIDRAGRIYLREDADTVVIDRAGQDPLRVTGMQGWSLRPGPNGSQLAAFARNRLSLLDASGATVWTVGFPGISDVAWTPDGGLVALAGDLARIDVATGHVIAAQCGWAFALRGEHPEIEDFPSTSETLCDR
jgi:hypothetical protein